MRVLKDGSYTFSDRLEISGDGGGNFVFARGWLLEIIDIEAGEYSFISDGTIIHPSIPRFGAYYPPFSLVKTHVINGIGRVKGIGSTEPLFDLPDSPILFATSFDGEFTDKHQALEILAASFGRQTIDINSSPSLLSIRTKRLIDDNYLASPSISRIATRLKVSGPHLSRQFKRDYGLSPSGYLHQLRVTDATLRLALGEEIVDISHEVGYNDLSRFYKQFKRTTRTSPGACRELLSS